MVFIEAPAFTRHVRSYLDDDDFRALQSVLLTNPEAGAVMPQTGGFRKVRWPDRRRGKGARGGLRIIYYYFVEDAQVWFMTVYAKDEISDLAPSQRRVLRAAIQAECEARRENRARRKR